MTTRNLAIDGGQPAFPAGPPQWPVTDEAITAAVNRALESGEWGKYDSDISAELIEKLKSVFTVEQVQLCSSGTIAVELALRGAGVRQGDEVIMAAYDFPGNFRAVEAIGAKPVLIDVEASQSNWLINLEQIAQAHGEATKAVLVSHLHGGTVDMRAAREIAEQNKLVLVEDACQSPGGQLNGKPLGSWGDVAAISFGGSKLLSAGRGGAILTNDEAILQRARIFAERGNDAFPLSQLQAAVLTPQLDQLSNLTARRMAGVESLTQTLYNLQPAFSFLEKSSAEFTPATYKYPLLVDPSIRDLFIRACTAEGIAIGEGFRGFANRSQKRCRKPVPLSNSIIAAKQTALVSHPIFLEPNEVVEKLANVLHEVYHRVLTERPSLQ